MHFRTGLFVSLLFVSAPAFSCGTFSGTYVRDGAKHQIEIQQIECQRLIVTYRFPNNEPVHQTIDIDGLTYYWQGNDLYYFEKKTTQSHCDIRIRTSIEQNEMVQSTRYECPSNNLGWISTKSGWKRATL
jgi:hypothetical protein